MSIASALAMGQMARHATIYENECRAREIGRLLPTPLAAITMEYAYVDPRVIETIFGRNVCVECRVTLPAEKQWSLWGDEDDEPEPVRWFTGFSINRYSDKCSVEITTTTGSVIEVIEQFELLAFLDNGMFGNARLDFVPKAVRLEVRQQLYDYLAKRGCWSKVA